MFDKLEAIERRFIHLEESLMRPDLDGEQTVKLSKERAEIEELVTTYREYKSVKKNLEDTKEILEGGDKEFAEMAREEFNDLQDKLKDISQRLKILLLPSDPRDSKNVLLEIRAGTGGDEATLFCADLLRMYCRYAEKRGWRVETLSSTESARGGFKEIVLLIQGDKVFSRLKFEMGVHRVQRVPVTEASGRIHTSACTVAVLAEADEIEIQINPADLKIDTFRASGAGGQHVNRTDSAVRITHVPSGMVIECQDERSQHKNKDRAMKMLRSRLLEHMQRQQDEARSQDRKLQVGSGDRSERIRTYNFPQGRVTDHRINLTLYRLAEAMEGDIDEVLDALGTFYTAEQLKAHKLNE